MTRTFRPLAGLLTLVVAGCAANDGQDSDSDMNNPGVGGSDVASGGGSSGGVPGVGGSLTGGAPGSGGMSTGGGGLSSGGDFGSGGDVGVGGEPFGTGGNFSTGGDTGTGGLPSSGGDSGAGGSVGTGGDTGAGGQPSVCNDPGGQVCNSYQTGQHCGLTFEIWTDSNSACMTNTGDGFLAVWDEGDMNYLARKGVRPGSDAPIVTYSADYNPNGNSYLGVYGWTTDPLIEYYIVDSWGSWRPPGTDVIGTVTVDGGTYEIYRSLRENQPSILGTATFWQYWSVRTQKRTSGTITVKPHFDAWAAFGLTLGDFYEVSMLVEGYHSSGSADVVVSFQ